MNIYLDFDGTVVDHQHPQIGEYNEGCIEVVEKLKYAGHKIVLNTYRANFQDASMAEAEEYLRAINLYHCIEATLPQKYDPSIWNWELHHVMQEIFLDDMCLDIPLRTNETSGRSMVNWHQIDKELEANGMYKSNKRQG